MSLSSKGEPTRRGGIGGSSARVGSWRRVLRVEVLRGKGCGAGIGGVDRTCGEDMVVVGVGVIVEGGGGKWSEPVDCG